MNNWLKKYMFILILLSAFLKAGVIVEDFKISLRVDERNNRPTNITDKIPDKTQTIYASAQIKNASPNTKIIFKWYRHAEEDQINVLYQSKIITSGSHFLHSAISISKGHTFPEGEYLVDIMIDDHTVKTTTFEIYKNIQRNTSQWKKFSDEAVDLGNHGKYTQSLQLLKKAIKISENETPVNYGHIIENLNNMSSLYSNLGENEKEEKYYKKAIEIAKKTIGLNTFESAVAMRGMAFIYHRREDYDKAEKYYIKVLKVFNKELYSYDRSIMITRNYLANLYLSRKQYSKAELLAKQTLKALEDHYGTKNQELVRALISLSDVYLYSHRNDKAEYYLKRSLTIMNESPNANPVIMNGVLDSMSQFYIQTKQYKNAEIIIKKYITSCRKLYGSKNNKTITALKDLADIYAVTKRLKKAKKINNEIARLINSNLKMQKQSITNENKQTKATISNKKVCSPFNKQEDKKMFLNLFRRYPELTIDDIKIHKPKRYYDENYGVSIVAPKGWNSITKEGDDILYLIQGDDTETSKFMFKSLAKFWDDIESKQPKKIIKKAARIIGEISDEEAIKDGDKTSPLGSLRLFTRGQLTIGHFVLHRIGRKTRWESYTLIWDGTRLYMLAVTSKEDELLLGEFLSSLGMKSFCSEIRKLK